MKMKRMVWAFVVLGVIGLNVMVFFDEGSTGNCPYCVQSTALATGTALGTCSAIREYAPPCLNACCIGDGTTDCSSLMVNSFCSYYDAMSSATYPCNCIWNCSSQPNCNGWYEITNWNQCKERVYDILNSQSTHLCRSPYPN